MGSSPAEDGKLPSKAKREAARQRKRQIIREMYVPGRNRAEKRRALKRMKKNRQRKGKSNG